MKRLTTDSCKYYIKGVAAPLPQSYSPTVTLLTPHSRSHHTRLTQFTCSQTWERDLSTVKRFLIFTCSKLLIRSIAASINKTSKQLSMGGQVIVEKTIQKREETRRLVIPFSCLLKQKTLWGGQELLSVPLPPPPEMPVSYSEHFIVTWLICNTYTKAKCSPWHFLPHRYTTWQSAI